MSNRYLVPCHLEDAGIVLRESRPRLTSEGEELVYRFDDLWVDLGPLAVSLPVGAAAVLSSAAAAISLPLGLLGPQKDLVWLSGLFAALAAVLWVVCFVLRANEKRTAREAQDALVALLKEHPDLPEAVEMVNPGQAVYMRAYRQ